MSTAFLHFSAKKSRRAGMPGGEGNAAGREKPKTYAFAFCGSKICGATRIRITTRTVVRMASGSM